MTHIAALILPLLFHTPVAPDSAVPPPMADTARAVVEIQPLGDVDSAIVTLVKRDLESTFDARIDVRSGRPLPPTAYFATRDRYRADRILAVLADSNVAPNTRIVALTTRDVSATLHGATDWGVIGLARPSRGVAVVSTHRLGRACATPGRFATRLSSVVEHELGHTWGLPHCATPGCIMNDACGSLSTVDRSSGAFCAACRARLGARLRPPATAIEPLAAAGAPRLSAH